MSKSKTSPEDRLRRVRYLVAQYEDPGVGVLSSQEHCSWGPHEYMVAIAYALGPECSICRRRHGEELIHACE